MLCHSILVSYVGVDVSEEHPTYLHAEIWTLKMGAVLKSVGSYLPYYNVVP
jgi:hypothetical protein